MSLAAPFEKLGYAVTRDELIAANAEGKGQSSARRLANVKYQSRPVCRLGNPHRLLQATADIRQAEVERQPPV